MATRIYEIAFTVPAGTPITAPASLSWFTEDNLINDIELEIPSGHNGVTGIRVMKGDTQLLPWGFSSFIVATDYHNTFPVGAYMSTRDIKLQGYNTGTNPHTFYLRMSVSDYNVPLAGNQPAVPDSIPATDIVAAPDPLSPDAILGPITSDQLASGDITASDVTLVDTSALTAPPVPAPTGL